MIAYAWSTKVAQPSNGKGGEGPGGDDGSGGKGADVASRDMDERASGEGQSVEER